VDHPRHDHDDYANALFGAIYFAQRKKRDMRQFQATSGDGLSGFVEVDPKTGRAFPPRRSHLVRDADGQLRIRGGDNSAWTTEELKRRAAPSVFIERSFNQ
jgi:hypothetical protein